MTDSVEIVPLAGPLATSVRPPGSKSLTNRALVCAALASGTSELRGALDSEDTRVMIDALGKLGVNIEQADAGTTLRVEGANGHFATPTSELFVANSGTTMRFLTGAAALAAGEVVLDGIPRMRERPIGDLVDALQQLGAEVECLGENRCPPVRVRGEGIAGGVAEIRGDISSQFLSGLLMVAPYAAQDVSVRVEGTLVSVPYVEMTLAVMRAFGAQPAASESYRDLVVPTSAQYQATRYDIEPDASAASYFLAAAAVVGGSVQVAGLSRQSLQGDVLFCDCLKKMGCRIEYGRDGITAIGDGKLVGIDVDMNAISDTVQTLAVVALFADGPTRIRNVGHIRHKETDRLAATAAELRKLGASVTETDDGLEISPQRLRGASIDTYNDHRMAMSFAVAGLRQPGVIINDPGCTTKTYPRFFDDLEQLKKSPGATR
ncbi:3-phosphoshikimate 1-carboxyvinyltransferase [Pirellulales bacterium]|nr:3-phosphoshikimate 1-carboxyvinyltransferase [Pirellulales bacterium]